MSFPTTKPIFDLHCDNGGLISDSYFRSVVHRLESTHSLHHTNLTPQSFDSYCGQTEVAVLHIILHPGELPDRGSDSDGSWLSTSHYTTARAQWLAGVCYLYLPNPEDRTTAHIAISLLPEARGKGFGRAAVDRLLEYAFDVLRVHRVVAPIICPVRPNDTPDDTKKAEHETKRLCWVFERCGFIYEGVSRGAVKNSRIQREPVWQDVHTMSMLETDYLARQMSGLFKGGVAPGNMGSASDPWESMIRRHEAEQQDMRLWAGDRGPVVAGSCSVSKVNGDDSDEYYDDGDSDEYEDP